jgi:hypothetical protein
MPRPVTQGLLIGDSSRKVGVRDDLLSQRFGPCRVEFAVHVGHQFFVGHGHRLSSLAMRVVP